MNSSNQRLAVAAAVISGLMVSALSAANSYAWGAPNPPAVPYNPGPGAHPPAQPVWPSPTDPNHPPFGGEQPPSVGVPPYYIPTPRVTLPNLGSLNVCGYTVSDRGHSATLCVSKSMYQVVNGYGRTYLRRDLGLDASFNGWTVEGVELTARSSWNGGEYAQLYINGSGWGVAQSIHGASQSYYFPVGNQFGAYPSDIQTFQLEFSGTGYLNVEEIRVYLRRSI